VSAGTTRPAGFRGEFLEDAVHREEHGRASGILKSSPIAVARPRDASDVGILVAWAGRSGVSIVPRGAATGMPGGNVGPGVAVDFRAGMRRIVSIDPERRLARVEPGVTLAELNSAAAPFGLHLPVDPSSGRLCTLGGMIANNAAGAHSVRHGATRAWVRSVEVVLSDGRRATATRGTSGLESPLGAIERAIIPRLEAHRDDIERTWPRVRKNSSGYAIREALESGDILDLLVGSEGTLGLVVSAEVSLAPLPRVRGLAVVEVGRLEDVGRAVPLLLPAGPATCELLDRTFLDLVRSGGGDFPLPVNPGAEGILFIEAEGDSRAEVEARLDSFVRLLDGIADRVTLSSEAGEQARLWELRHAASPIIKRLAGSRVPMQFIEDGVVPIPHLPEYIRALRAILARHGLPAVIFGHAGDGNLHVNPLVDVRSTGWLTEVEEVLEEVVGVIVELGGTLAGEHGDGRLRAPFVERIWGAALTEHFRAVKRAFDPGEILNPGVILPRPGQRPLEAIRTF
jgi:FAD/FMN-containing dehydrogenase